MQNSPETDVRIVDGQTPGHFSNQLSQSQTEALLELLVFAMYADGEIVNEEVQLLHKRAARFNWDSEKPMLDFIQEVSARLRLLPGSMAGRLAFLESIRERLETREVALHAYLFAEAMLRVDNCVAPSEEMFADEIVEVFGIAGELAS